jgi:hypothetical protein
MSDTSHQALSVDYRGGKTTVEGINSLGEHYALEIDGPNAMAWHDALRRNFYRRPNQECPEGK